MAILAIKVGNSYVNLPDPSEMTVKDELVWASNTGRTSSGTMVGDLKGYKVTVEAKWKTLTFGDMVTIRNAIKSAGGFFEIKYYDFGCLVEMTCYASGIPRQLYSTADNLQFYQDVTISFIEK